MLQAPSHLSRVCGHGHIKKFWLMQTQKESQACESKTSVMFPASSTPRAGNRASFKGLDSSYRNSPSPVAHGHGDASTFSCAKTLNPPRSFCKISPPRSLVSTGDVLRPTEPPNSTDSASRTTDQDAQPSTPSPRSLPLNVAFEFEGKSRPGLERSLTRVDPADSLLSEGWHRSEGSHSISHSTSEEDMSHSYGSHMHFQPSRREVRLMEPPSKSASATAAAYLLGMGKSRSIGSTSRYSDTELQHYSLNSGLKACTLCGTTKTPMWRSGPQGPKSLCNACGIRFKKYRSCPGQNEPLGLTISPSAGHSSPKSLARPLKRKHNPVLLTGEPPWPKKTRVKAVVPDPTSRQEKRNKWHQGILSRKEQGEFMEVQSDCSNIWNMPVAPASFKKIYGCFPFHSKFKKLDPMDKHHTLSKVFAKDEEEAAVLLMQLSCGLVY